MSPSSSGSGCWLSYEPTVRGSRGHTGGAPIQTPVPRTHPNPSSVGWVVRREKVGSGNTKLVQVLLPLLPGSVARGDLSPSSTCNPWLVKQTRGKDCFTYTALLWGSSEKNICVRGLHAVRRHRTLASLPHPGGRHVPRLTKAFLLILFGTIMTQ